MRRKEGGRSVEGEEGKRGGEWGERRMGRLCVATV